jgi:DNA-binding IclR family transcriptional regulator
MEAGLVTQDAATGLYDLGPFALTLGLAAIGRQDVVAQTCQQLPAIAEALHCTVLASVWTTAGPVVVRVVEAGDGLTVGARVGTILPLVQSATGRAFAAFNPTAAVTEMAARQLATSSPPNKEWPAIMRAAERHGYATTLGGWVSGFDAAAVPLADAWGVTACVVAAVIPHPPQARTLADLGEKLKQVTRASPMATRP